MTQQGEADESFALQYYAYYYNCAYDLSRMKTLIGVPLKSQCSRILFSR